MEALFDEQLAVAPPLSAEALAAIPARRGAVLLSAAEGAPILLITAADMRSRLRTRLAEPTPEQSTRRADLREITEGVSWRRTFSPFETDWAYLRIARAVFPDAVEELVAWRPAWFVSAEADAETPLLTATQKPSDLGRSLGPFAGKRPAEGFIAALVDGFDLCRCQHILRQAPRGAACAYKQMGRCDAPCDGTGSMDAYRRRLDEAARFAAGAEAEPLRRLEQRMRRAAAAMEFERAAGYKSRLESLAELEAQRYEHVAPLERLRYVTVQPGSGVGRARTFVCDRGWIEPAGEIEYPCKTKQLAKVLAQCDAAADAGADRPADRLGMGLVAHYLFAGPAKRGLWLRRDRIDAPERLAEAIEASAAEMKLRARAKRKRTADASGTSNEGDPGDKEPPRST